MTEGPYEQKEFKQQLEDALGIGRVYTTLYCTREEFIFRENRSQHRVLAHIGISDLSFRKGYLKKKKQTQLSTYYIKNAFHSCPYLIFSKLATNGSLSYDVAKMMFPYTESSRQKKSLFSQFTENKMLAHIPALRLRNALPV